MRLFLNNPLKNRGPLGWVLFPLLWVLSTLFAGGAWVRRHRYKASHPPFPTLCIGNVVMGGSGKSPVVLFLAQQVQHMGYQVAIVTRGYKKSPRDTLGDESLMLHSRLNPLGVRIMETGHRERVLKDLAKGWKGQPLCVLLDDGLQQGSCPRSRNLVLWDPELLLQAPGAAFPLGPYREGFLGRFRATLSGSHDLRLWSRCFATDMPQFQDLCRQALARFHMEPQPGTDYIVTKECTLTTPRGETVDPSLLPRGPLGALCGVGNPHHFFSDVERILQRPLTTKVAVADHGALSAPIPSLLESLEGIVTTEKDWARWQHHPMLKHWNDSKRLWVLSLNVSIRTWEGAPAPVGQFLLNP